MARDRGPNVSFPPPVAYIGAFLVGMLLHATVRELTIFGADGAPTWAKIGGVGLLVLGVLLANWGAITFRLATTAIVPMFPATTLVQHGPYRFTRNPMYVGMTLAYVGVAVALDTWWPPILLPFVLFVMIRFVIRKEERYLADTFGEAYETYKRSVRRWL